MPKKSTSESEAVQSPDFETSMEKLEKLVTEIEKGNLSLDESLKLFEEGIQLTRHCQTALDSAEQKIKILTAKDSLETIEHESEF